MAWFLRTAFFLSLLFSLDSQAEEFTTPDQRTRLAAIGDVGKLPPTLRKVYHADQVFAPIPDPGPIDWLRTQKESGQTVSQYIRSRPNRPDPQRNKIYLLPLGGFPAAQAETLKAVRAYAAIFFGLEVRVARAVPIKEPFTARVHHGKRQLLTRDLLDYLKRSLPDDAYCLIGVTMTDLYPQPSWNFVFGQASFKQRIGVYSFARYDPAFFGEPRGEDADGQFLRRCLQVFAHETGHMFGVHHCIYYHCVMNGSNSMQESDAAPLHLCPVCLRKLRYVLRFNPVDRYQKLAAFYKDHGLEDGLFIEQRLDELQEE